MEHFCLDIPVEYDGIRVDLAVSELMGELLSRSRIQNMIKTGELKVNEKAVKASLKAAEGDLITFDIADPVKADIEPENIPLSILYEDDDLLVVDKPKGMVVHPAPGHTDGTLVNALLYYLKDNLSGINGVMRPGIIHRIDKDTSGSLVVCKNDIAHIRLAEDFKTHSITRKYIGIVCGRVKEEQGTIETVIDRHPVDRKKMACFPKGTMHGKPAVTHYKVLEYFERYTLCEFTLETGRTHQIRVHMASIHYPLLGDLVYGTKDYKGLGQMLHAKELGFTHPITGKPVLINCPVPVYFEQCIQSLKR